jgi:hypothetical protein
MFARFHTLSACLDADHFHVVLPKRVEQTNRVTAAAHTRDEGRGQFALCRQHLLLCLAPDDALEFAHHRGIGVGTQCRTKQIVGVSHIRHPIAERLVDCILEGPTPRIDRAHLCAEQFHAKHIGLLTCNVFRPHIDDAFQPEHRARRSRRDAVLPCACLRHNASLAHALCQQTLPQSIVDLVRARVRKVFPLQVDARPSAQLG